MVDRDDDIKIGIKTSALTFGKYDVLAVMLCYGATLAILGGVGWWQKMGWMYYAGLAIAASVAGYHYTLIRNREREKCFKAFLHNNWFGAAVFAGIALDYFSK
jgi:4-hydroxybenzoate polyprenyltransferase